MSYDYRESVKSDISDELINTYFLRPVAGLIVWPLYYTSITPNQVTIVSIIAGLAAAAFYLRGTPAATAFAGLCITLKDVLDSADGQLARAKQQYTRIGRFLDSIGDFVVDLAVFGAIGWTLYISSGNLWMLVLATLGLLGISLRVSYHVFYHTSYLHFEKKYEQNRLTEEIQEEDTSSDPLVLGLQRVFQRIYGWQDRLMVEIDAWGHRGNIEESFTRRWYSDHLGLRISGLLGFGTELFLLTVCSILNKLELYLYFNLFLMNGIWIFSMIYRRAILMRALRVL